MTRKVLLVDDDRSVLEALAQTLELVDLDPVLASSFIVAKDHITAEFDGVILSDIRMPGRDGFHLLSYAIEQDKDLPVVLLTGEGDVPMAVQAMGQGAFDFLEKPCPPKELVQVLRRALQTRGLVLENRALRAQMAKGDPAARLLRGVSDLAESMRAQVRRLAEAGSDALVLGPPGSGIPKVAEVMHLCSARSKMAFVKRASRDLDVAAAQAALEAAQGGSLFLDEVAQLPFETQMMLAETLDTAPRARLFLGASTDLAQAAASGQFNADLYYGLAGMRVDIPALADRREDIPVLFRHYVAQAAEQAGQVAPDLPAALLSDLMGRDWPGNARALMSEAMRFVLGLEADSAPVTEDAGLSLSEQVAKVERAIIAQALQRCGGSARAAAESLQVPRKTFYDKLTRHGIRAEDFKS